MRSATRSGSFHGMITAAVPTSTLLVRPATYASHSVLSGQNE
ncbi:MAG: hypothetical protein QM733_04965 [Ilumatobacteraceae bacterium]